MRLAVRLHDLFGDWRTPGQRRFVLMAVKNALFCEHLWFDWDPAITAVNVPRRADQEPQIRRAADPAIAVSAVVARTARELGVGGEFRIGCDGSHILIETGETIPIAGPDRPALRAHLAVRANPECQLLERPQTADETTAAPDTVARPIPALSQIAGLLEVRPLVLRVSADAQPLTIGETGNPWNGMKPYPLDYRHTAVLSHLLRCVQRDEYPREPLRGSTPDDIQVLHDLYHHGLVIAGAHRRPELGHWPQLLWNHGRVTMPPSRRRPSTQALPGYRPPARR